MKCHAGVEFPDGEPCPKCKAKLGEVCWPGINADLLELPKLRKALEFIRDGYDNQDINHVDFRVKAYQVALDALGSVGGMGRE
jgi:hypothetical protein